MLQMLVPPAAVTPSDPELDSCTSDLQCCDLVPSGDECDPSDSKRCLAERGLFTAIGNPRFAFSFRYHDRCARELEGQVVLIDGETLAPLPDADQAAVLGTPVVVRYADTPGAPRLGVHSIDPIAPIDRETQCSSDAECIAGEQFCDPETDQCVLALAGGPRTGAGSNSTRPGALPRRSTRTARRNPSPTPTTSARSRFRSRSTGLSRLSALSYTTEVHFRPPTDRARQREAGREPLAQTSLHPRLGRPGAALAAARRRSVAVAR